MVPHPIHKEHPCGVNTPQTLGLRARRPGGAPPSPPRLLPRKDNGTWLTRATLHACTRLRLTLLKSATAMGFPR
eukprot:5682721-Prymnesium_polylepis.2